MPVWDIARMVVEHYGARTLKDASDPNDPHEAKLLALDLDTSKARYELGWKPKWNIRTTIEKTVEWYTQYQKENVYQLCLKQIAEYNDTKDKIVELVKEYYREQFESKKSSFEPGDRINYGGRFF